MWVAVAGGCGFVRGAPGTAGAALAAVGFLTMAWMVGGVALGRTASQLAFVLVVIAISLVGVWASGHAEVIFSRHDDGRIVIDEVAGQLVALGPLLWAGTGVLSELSSIFFWVVTGFVLFRVFDVWKPGAIRWAERHFTGGLGVMADDLVAGGHAAGVMLVLMHVLAV